MRALS